jgi:RNA polymerase sigma factor (TIGR02999 family)
MSDVTRILGEIERGDLDAAGQLLPLVYDELRRLAAEKMARERSGQTLEATGLVHEAYLRLVGDRAATHWNGRGHFFAAAAEAMRRILVENARRKRSHKHGGGLTRHAFDGVDAAVPDEPDDLLALDEALAKLTKADPKAAELVRLRYYAGLPIPAVAEILGISPRSADRLWAYARAWLHRELRDAAAGDNS